MIEGVFMLADENIFGLLRFEWNILCGDFSMLLVSKGYTKLEVNLREEVKVRVWEVPLELLETTRAIAASLRSLLLVKIKLSPDRNKEEVVGDYLKKLGWQVDRQEN